ncbi:MAG: NeuD/PglB/VioB family sugar acetyltransferase [Gemmatimonadota bacterium]
MVEQIGIVGGGGHGKVIADLVRALGHRVGGYIDSDPRKLGAVVESGGGVVVMGQDELIAFLSEGRGLPAGLTQLALGVGANPARFRLLQQVPHAHLGVLVHPAATVSPSATLGPGTVVFAAAVVNADVAIGPGGIVNTGATIEHDCRLAEAVHISPGAVLAGGVRVGVRGWIGAGAIVLPGVCIGDDAVVGAGAVCLEEVAPGTTVAGNPARIIGRKTS